VRHRALLTAICGLGLILGGGGCGVAQITMNPNDPIIGADKVREIVGRAAAASLPDEVAETKPMITATSPGPRLVVVFYNETGPPHARKVGLPHHLIEVHPVTGQVLRFAKCRPAELGISTPPAPVPGVDFDKSLPIEEQMKLSSRFFSISAQVWGLFLHRASRPLDEPGTQLVREYWHIFAHTTKKEIAPYYVGAAPDFFAWLRATASK